ncbi:DUF3488 and transglutaminase-like domain-containing protein [Brooklawnia cerclae]|uniref:Transglutaminase-like putative cysteine protease n=1 Tax=Brooklawnia cerclae TaxID=349934 RepID=A0ABX0SKE8_9ACTN|nr:DUF3488 and transglutaminase-like domain-containing protein [Brooklawnia cerclae]NIH57525.1 transglutaminase-like putative cysteine protease [Brooklawnia cerclae]
MSTRTPTRAATTDPAPARTRSVPVATTRDTLAVGLAAVLAALPLQQVTDDRRFWAAAIAVVVVLQLIAAATRALAHRAWLPSLVQVVVLTLGTWVAAGLQTGLLLGVPPWGSIELVVRTAAQHIATQPAPMAADDATLIVLTAAVGIMCLLVDFCFVVLGSGLLAVLPLLGSYLAASVVNTQAVWPGSMVAVCAAWLLLLATRTIDHDRRWSRGLARSTGSRPGAAVFVARALQLGAPAVALALVAGLAVPAVGARDLWQPGGDGTVQLVDPSIDLSENLRQPEDLPLLAYTTTATGGVYLRTSTLTTVNDSGWVQIDMSIQQGFPSRAPGVSGTRPTIDTQISIGDFASVYLPAPYAPSSWAAEGRWGYDPVSLTVLSTDRQLGAEATRDLTYSVESLVVDPTSEQLADAVAGTPPEGSAATEVPDDVPEEIIELARQITADATTDGQRAVAIQNWLRDPTRFTYDVNAPDGTGYEVLVNFLLDSRSGYCVHFAAAMALMARVVGIGSRVAVGFTPGEQQADGSWVVSAHDMHAWPELYFSGIGWVRFEPTVSIGNDPSWTQLEQEQPQSEPTTTTTSAPTTQASTSTPSATPSESATDETDEPAGTEAPADYGWLWWIVAALAVAAAPGLIRAALRLRRTSGRGDASRRIGGAWQELRASAIDLGVGWPDGTPRHVSEALSPTLDAAGGEALDRVAVLEERARYAAGVPQDATVATDVALVTKQWRTRVGTWTRLWTRIVPRSLFPRSLSTSSSALRDLR